MKKISIIVASLFLSISIFAQDDFGTGLKFDQKLYEETPQSVPLITRSFTALPSSFSLKGYAPTPQSQGRQGSCVGWASAFGARTIANAIKNNWQYNTSMINQNIYSPAFVYNQIRVNNNCEGAYIENAMKLLNTYGAAKMTEFPYTDQSCTSAPSSYVYSSASQHKIITYERLARWDNPVNLVGNSNQTDRMKVSFHANTYG